MTSVVMTTPSIAGIVVAVVVANVDIVFDVDVSIVCVLVINSGCSHRRGVLLIMMAVVTVAIAVVVVAVVIVVAAVMTVAVVQRGSGGFPP